MKKRAVFLSILSCLLTVVAWIDAAANTNQDLAGFADRVIPALRNRIHSACRVWTGHTEQVNTVAVSPNGARAASGSWDATARIWNMRTGNCLHVLKGHTSGVTSLAFSPDNTHIATGSWDQTVRIWNAVSGACVHEFETKNCGVLSLAYSSDGRILAAGSVDGCVTVWNAGSGTCLFMFKFHEAGITSLSFLDNSLIFVAGSRDGTVRKWNAISRECLQTCGGYSNWMSTLSLAAKKSRIAFPHGNEVYLRSTEKDEYKKTLSGHTDGVTAVAFNNNGNTLASASFDHTIRVWDVDAASNSGELKGHNNWVSSVAYTSSGALISGSYDKTVRVWYDPGSDMQKVSDIGEQELLMRAAQDWAAGRAHEINANDELYNSLIKRFAYLFDERLFAVRQETLSSPFSQEAATSRDDEPAEDFGYITLPARMHAYTSDGNLLQR